MGNYHAILMKIGKQIKKHMLSSKITEAEVYTNFQDGRRRHVGNSSACSCYKMGSYHPISLKTGTQTKKHMLSSRITKAEVQAEFQDGRRRQFGN
jgi:hypothetical protein